MDLYVKLGEKIEWKFDVKNWIGKKWLKKNDRFYEKHESLGLKMMWNLLVKLCWKNAKKSWSIFYGFVCKKCYEFCCEKSLLKFDLAKNHDDEKKTWNKNSSTGWIALTARDFSLCDDKVVDWKYS